MKRRKKPITQKSLFRPLDMPIGIPSSAGIIKICVITAGIKKYKSLIKKNKKNKHDKIVLLGKDKLNIIKVVISKAFVVVGYRSRQRTIMTSSYVTYF